MHNIKEELNCMTVALVPSGLSLSKFLDAEIVASLIMALGNRLLLRYMPLISIAGSLCEHLQEEIQ